MPFFGMSSFVRCNRAMSSRSVGFPPPHSESGRSSSRRFNVSRSTSRTKTPSNRCINFAKLREPPQTKCYRFILVGDQGLYSIHMPNVVLVCQAIRRFTGFRIALVSQFAVTMNGTVAAPLQFIADRSFAGARKAFNQIISNAHSLEDSRGGMSLNEHIRQVVPIQLDKGPARLLNSGAA
jgi:hypothetical protein